MIPVNGKIIVSVDLEQKNKMLIDGMEFYTATKFETNYREKSPTIATVVDGNEFVKAGDILLCHHNLFYLPSPYHLYDNLYAIPFSKVLFAKIDKEGNIEPICGNVIVERIAKKEMFSVEHKTEDKIYRLIDKGWTTYKNGSILFTRPSAGYDIVYNIDGIEKRITKVDSEQICGVVKP